MVTRSVKRVCVLAAVVAAGTGLAGRAEAQQVEVRVVVPQVTAREIRATIERALEQALDPKLWAEISRELNEALRESLTGAHEAAREVAEALRESARASRFSGGTAGAWQDRNFSQEQIAKESHTLQLGAAGSLILKNVAGDVTVTAGSGRAATVEVVRRSRGRTEADAKLGLDRVKIEVDHRGERATVTTVYPDDNRRPPYAVSATYTVTAPAGTSMTIATISGDVHVTNIKGDTSVNVTSGDVTVIGSRLSSAKTVSGNVTITDSDATGALEVGTLSGDLRLQRVKARRLSMSTLNGDVVARDIDTGDAALSTQSGDVEFGGALSPSGRYDLRSHSGDVRVGIPQGAFDVSARTFNGRITTDPNLGVKTTSSSRTSLRGTVGAGGASLEITTFSGDISISKK